MSINRGVTTHKQVLAKKLNLFHLIAFGLNYMIPFAPAIIFGIVAKQSGTTVAIPYLFAMIVMSFTAFSYVYMVKRNPVAGSLYSYVESIFGKRIGFLSGWILFLDYILIPTVVAISATIYLQHYLPEVPYSVILIVYVLATGLFNLLGISIVANVGLILLILMEVLLVICLITLGKFSLAQNGSLISSYPFEFSSFNALFVATTLCVLSYLGYDAISTLAEEAKQPVRDVPKAIVFSLLFSGVMMFFLGYLGVLASPDIASNFNNKNWVESALFYIMGNAGGETFTIVFTTGLIICLMIFNIVSTAAGSRLLFGMGRDRAIPRSIFGKVNKRFKTPHYNVLIIIILELILGLSLTLDYIVDLVNYGAILGFTILNISVSYRIWTRKENRFLAVFPFIGAVTMIIMILMMNKYTLIVGASWTIAGVILMFSNKYLKQYSNINNTNESDIADNIIINLSDKKEFIDVLKSHWDYDHWNVSNNHIRLILNNKEALYILEKNSEVIGSISAYNYNSTFSYFGLFYIISEYRGLNYGAYLTGVALSHWQNRKVACDAVYSQVLKYQKIGFNAIYENKRYVFTESRSFEISRKIIPAIEIDIALISEYDAKHFYCQRYNEINFWIQNHKEDSFLYIQNNEIKGFICITKAKETYRISPLYAENIEIAIELIKVVTNEYQNELISIDIPQINKNKHGIISYFNMTETHFKLVRMHKGKFETKNINNLYGHLSIEIG